MRIVTLLLALLLVFAAVAGLSGCGRNTEEEGGSTTTTAATTTTSMSTTTTTTTTTATTTEPTMIPTTLLPDINLTGTTGAR